MPYCDPERRREYGRAWMRRNAGRAREGMRRWRERHPDAHRAENRAYYARDPERRQRQIESSPNRGDVRKAADARRRARKLDASGSYTSAEWRSLVDLSGGRCAYCGVVANLHADHRQPLSRGGSNAINNIVPACASCNIRKSILTESEFRARLAAEAATRSSTIEPPAG